MKDKIFAVIGAIAASISLASSVHAQAIEKFTLAGTSPKIENLTIEDDYKEFFMRAENSADNSLNLGNNARDPYIFADGNDGVWQISNNWEFQVNEPLSPPIFPVPFRY
jgi:hypothetical protein